MRPRCGGHACPLRAQTRPGGEALIICRADVSGSGNPAWGGSGGSPTGRLCRSSPGVTQGRTGHSCGPRAPTTHGRDSRSFPGRPATHPRPRDTMWPQLTSTKPNCPAWQRRARPRVTRRSPGQGPRTGQDARGPRGVRRGRAGPLELTADGTGGRSLGTSQMMGTTWGGREGRAGFQKVPWNRASWSLRAGSCWQREGRSAGQGHSPGSGGEAGRWVPVRTETSA